MSMSTRSGCSEAALTTLSAPSTASTTVSPRAKRNRAGLRVDPPGPRRRECVKGVAHSTSYSDHTGDYIALTQRNCERRSYAPNPRLRVSGVVWVVGPMNHSLVKHRRSDGGASIRADRVFHSETDVVRRRIIGSN